jgi:ribosome maturation factor RimP
MRTRKSTAAAMTASHAPDRFDRAGKRRPDRSSGPSGPAATSGPSNRPTSAIGAWTLTPALEAEIAELAAGCGCELIHAEWKGGVLRLVLDRPPAEGPAETAAPAAAEAPAGPAIVPDVPHVPHVPDPGGVSLGDCELVAKQTSALLDVLDFGNGRYVLEVSSPGLDRQLYRPSDYQRFLGRLARVTYQQAAADTADPGNPADRGTPRRRTVVARLAALRPPAGASDAGEVTLVDDRTGERLTVRLEDVRMARLEVEL